jgi:hypothetical protein
MCKRYMHVCMYACVYLCISHARHVHISHEHQRIQARFNVQHHTTTPQGTRVPIELTECKGPCLIAKPVAYKVGVPSVDEHGDAVLKQVRDLVLIVVHPIACWLLSSSTDRQISTRLLLVHVLRTYLLPPVASCGAPFHVTLDISNLPMNCTFTPRLHWLHFASGATPKVSFTSGRAKNLSTPLQSIHKRVSIQQSQLVCG